MISILKYINHIKIYQSYLNLSIISNLSISIILKYINHSKSQSHQNISITLKSQSYRNLSKLFYHRAVTLPYTNPTKKNRNPINSNSEFNKNRTYKWGESEQKLTKEKHTKSSFRDQFDKCAKSCSQTQSPRTWCSSQAEERSQREEKRESRSLLFAFLNWKVQLFSICNTPKSESRLKVTD